MFEWGFLFKKIIAAFCMPLPFLVLLLLLAAVLYWRKKFFLSKYLSIFACLFFYLISIQASSDFLNAHLEYQYPLYQKNENKPADFVLVLGSDHISDESQPVTSLLSSAGLMRLAEGIRAYRLNSGSKLLLSGYSVSDAISHAQALKRVAIHFGVPEEDMILAGDVKDTKEEADHWSQVASGKTLVLVTSASHMPRSMYLFKQTIAEQGLDLAVIPAPTDYISHKTSNLRWKDWFPSGRNIYNVERAWHEYLGIFWAFLAS